MGFNQQRIGICTLVLTALFIRSRGADVLREAPCCDRTSNLGPVRVEWVSELCFKTVYMELPGCAGPCCNNDVFRVDFGVRPECLGAIRNVSVVPVEPGDAESAYVAWEWNYNVLSIANIWEGYTYCVELNEDAASCGARRLQDVCDTPALGFPGSCEYSVIDTLAKCCPTFTLDAGQFDPVFSSPPPPPPPPPPPQSPLKEQRFPGFPYCNCVTRASQYTMQYEGVNAEGEQCFYVWTKDACEDPTSPCCTFTVNKVEFGIPRECAGSVGHARINGQIRAMSQSLNNGANKDKAVFKVTNLALPASVVPVEVCLKLRDNGPCPSLNAFCGSSGSCTYAVFEKQMPGKDYCCAVGQALL